MRAPRNATSEEMVALLSSNQQFALNQMTMTADKVNSAKREINASSPVLRERIFEAFNSGVPVKLIMDKTGLTRPRIYQIVTELKKEPKNVTTDF